VRQEVPDEQELAIEVHGRDQPEPVPADVENAKPADAIDAAEQRFHVGEMRDPIRLDALSPDPERCCRFRMKRREVDEALIRNDTHADDSISN